MLNEALSRRYASAIYSMAAEQKIAPTVLADLKLIDSTVNGHDKLKAAMMSPTLGDDLKQAISQKVFSADVNPLSMHFYMLLLKKGREAFLGDIIELFSQMLLADLGVVNVKVEVATKLDPLLEALITTNMVKKTGKKIELNVEVHPELIAGAVIITGESFYDGSLKHQLEQMYKLLKQDEE